MSPFDGARARTLRREAGVCLEDLAAAAGISPNTARSAEAGTHAPRPHIAAAIANALGVPLAELTTDDGPLTLHSARQRLGLTQADIARRVGTARQMVSRIERGVGGVSAPERWAAAYGLTLDQWNAAVEATRGVVRQRVAARTHRRDTGNSGDR